MRGVALCACVRDHYDTLIATNVFKAYPAARTICAYFATDRAKKRYSVGMKEEYDRITKTLCPLVAAGDRLGLVQLLRDWEASSVEHLKLQKLWEPTPFPIELQRERE